ADRVEVDQEPLEQRQQVGQQVVTEHVGQNVQSRRRTLPYGGREGERDVSFLQCVCVCEGERWAIPPVVLVVVCVGGREIEMCHVCSQTFCVCVCVREREMCA